MIGQLFNQFVIAFREGIEASLIIMIVLMALKKRNAQTLIRSAKAGIFTAIIACAIGGYILGTIALVNNHGLEVILYSAACVTVITMVFWMMRTGKRLKTGIEERIDGFESRTGFWGIVGMFAFVFFMITREGFEMVLLLIAFGAGVGGWSYVLAMLLGISCAVLVAYALSRGVLKFNLGKFLQWTSAVLLLFVVQLIFDVWHEAMEGGFVPQPTNQGLANFVDYVHDQFPIFSDVGLALFAVIVIYFFIQSASGSGKGAPLAKTSHQGAKA